MTGSTSRPGFGAHECRRNIRWYLVYRVMYEFGIWFPIWILFLHDELGLSFLTILLLDAIYQALLVVMEIPTGMLADSIGRRKVMILSVVSMAISLLLLGLAQDFVLVLASFFMWALAIASLNGADSAFLYESLHAAGRSGEFPKLLGRLTTIAMCGSVVAMAIGGWLATYGYRVPIFVHVALLPIAVFAAIRFIEPPRTGEVAAAGPREILHSMKERLTHGTRFRALLGFSATVHIVFFMVVIFKQPVLIQSGLTVTMLGWIYAGGTLLAALGPLTLTWLRLRMGTWSALTVSAVAIAFACAGIFGVQGAWVLLPFLVAEFCISGIRPVVIDGLNSLAGPQGRATALSLRGIVDAAVAGPFEVLSGWFADRVPLRHLFLAAAVGLPALHGLLTAYWKRGAQDTLAPTDSREAARRNGL